MKELGISPKNRRQHERLPSCGPVLVSWDDEQGLVRYSHAKLLDVSQDGLRIEMAEPLPVRSRVLLRADRINFSGSATVRSVAWRGCKYTMGLSLSQAQSSSALFKIGRPDLTVRASVT
jgi:PilZ domain